VRVCAVSVCERARDGEGGEGWRAGGSGYTDVEKIEGMEGIEEREGQGAHPLHAGALSSPPPPCSILYPLLLRA
jgi:hypothetical protein